MINNEEIKKPVTIDNLKCCGNCELNGSICPTRHMIRYDLSGNVCDNWIFDGCSYNERDYDYLDKQEEKK